MRHFALGLGSCTHHLTDLMSSVTGLDSLEVDLLFFWNETEMGDGSVSLHTTRFSLRVEWLL